MRRCHPLFGGLLLALVSLPTLIPACIWIEGTTLDGKWANQEPLWHYEGPLWHAMGETPAQKLQRLEKGRRVEGGDQREAEAVRKILSGDPAAAVSLLQKIEEETPGKYSTAANLGTAYELAGDNRNALKWISEGIQRDPRSHYGTEWLHALILETKLRIETDPDYLKTHRIIPLPETFDAETMVDVSGTKRSIRDIARALGYQLTERVVFVKPSDPVVADLLFTLALCDAHGGVLEGSVKLLKKSQEYGFQDPALLESTKGQFESIIEKAAAGRVKSTKRSR